LQELHSDVWDAVALVRFIDGDHIVVGDLSGGMGFAEESLLGEALAANRGSITFSATERLSRVSVAR